MQWSWLVFFCSVRINLRSNQQWLATYLPFFFLPSQPLWKPFNHCNKQCYNPTIMMIIVVITTATITVTTTKAITTSDSVRNQLSLINQSYHFLYSSKFFCCFFCLFNSFSFSPPLLNEKHSNFLSLLLIFCARIYLRLKPHPYVNIP